MYVENSETNQDILDELNTKSALTETLDYRRGICLQWQECSKTDSTNQWWSTDWMEQETKCNNCS
jgi:hypothetical protein